MKMRDKQLKRYYRSVRSCLPCSGKQKAHILSSIENTVGVYLAENPDADFASIQRQLGTPEQIAAAYLGTVDVPELLHRLRIRNRILKIAGATAAVVLLLWVSVVTWAVHLTKTSADGQFIEGKAVVTHSFRIPAKRG